VKPHSYTGGWIKLHRSLLDSPHFKDSEWVHVWNYILLKASHQRHGARFNGDNYDLAPGMFISSRREIAVNTGVNEAKVWRVIKTMESEDQIALRQGSTKAMFTVLNWETYQHGEDRIADPMKTQ
jgi:hypothetical protein